MADSTIRIVFCVILSVIAVFAIVSNVFVFFTCGKRKRLRKPFRFFLILLAVADILAVALWTSLTIGSLASGGWTWINSDIVCKVHEYFRTLFLLINMHTFGLLAIERGIYFFKPSRHLEIFINTVVVIMVVALVVFDAIMAVFPFANWGEVAYSANQYQCAMKFEENVSQMNFMFILTFGLPFLICVIVYSAIFVRLRKLKKATTDEGAIILEEDKYAHGDSYSQRLKNQQLKFQNAGMRSKKPQIGKKLSFTNEGYVSNDSSGDEMPQEGAAGFVEKKKQTQKKIHYLSKNDMTLIKTYIITTICYAACWLPYVIIMYVITYNRYTPVADDLVTSLVVLTHCSLFVKPLVYVLHNGYFRTNFKKSFQKEKYQSFDKRPTGEQTEEKDAGENDV